MTTVYHATTRTGRLTTSDSPCIELHFTQTDDYPADLDSVIIDGVDVTATLPPALLKRLRDYSSEVEFYK